MTHQRITYVNGDYVPAESAAISPLDRGFIFGDGVYEVIPVYHGKLFHLKAHIERLNQSLKGIKMAPVMPLEEWDTVLNTLIEKNNRGNQYIYLQVTRGVEWVRNLNFPDNIKPTVFAISYPMDILSKEDKAKGLRATTVTDIRWKYCNIKATSRLAYVLMYQEAKENGFDEAIIINNGLALEGTSSNLFVIRHGVIMTPPLSSFILAGITRDYVLSLAESNKMPYRETKIAERDLLKADEIWVTSSVRGIVPVVSIDGELIGEGKAGPVWNTLWEYHAKKIAEFSV